MRETSVTLTIRDMASMRNFDVIWSKLNAIGTRAIEIMNRNAPLLYIVSDIGPTGLAA
jgi:hypothetical protein